jgi:hypothetical protein
VHRGSGRGVHRQNAVALVGLPVEEACGTRGSIAGDLPLRSRRSGSATAPPRSVVNRVDWRCTSE